MITHHNLSLSILHCSIVCFLVTSCYEEVLSGAGGLNGKFSRACGFSPHIDTVSDFLLLEYLR